uniref:Uncharacterized protein n=1 Tax=Physcomitrium patens TaxID=3218 RepID=A0A2K1JH86_PHYPA|nr:hypothetical protein PHYPA_018318 [Physcomitrium patens]
MRYGEGHPSDEVVQKLVEECEGVAQVSVSSTMTQCGEEAGQCCPTFPCAEKCGSGPADFSAAACSLGPNCN